MVFMVVSCCRMDFRLTRHFPYDGWELKHLKCWKCFHGTLVYDTTVHYNLLERCRWWCQWSSFVHGAWARPGTNRHVLYCRAMQRIQYMKTSDSVALISYCSLSQCLLQSYAVWLVGLCLVWMLEQTVTGKGKNTNNII